jgi:hypothetical protein
MVTTSVDHKLIITIDLTLSTTTEWPKFKENTAE